MKYKTHNDQEININGTCRAKVYRNFGRDITYQDIVNVFGEPMESHCDKADLEWHIQYEDGTIATIYNYKSGYNYLGKYRNLKNMRGDGWHIGCNNEDAAAMAYFAVIDFKETGGKDPFKLDVPNISKIIYSHEEPLFSCEFIQVKTDLGENYIESARSKKTGKRFYNTTHQAYADKESFIDVMKQKVGHK